MIALKIFEQINKILLGSGQKKPQIFLVDISSNPFFNSDFIFWWFNWESLYSAKWNIILIVNNMLSGSYHFLKMKACVLQAVYRSKQFLVIIYKNQYGGAFFKFSNYPSVTPKKVLVARVIRKYADIARQSEWQIMSDK